MSALCRWCGADFFGIRQFFFSSLSRRIGALAVVVVLCLPLAVVAAPPLITSQPQARNVVEGSSVAFTVVASGTEPLHYQWRLGVVDLPGMTSPTLSLTGVQTNQAGFHSVVVTNLEGVVTSALARLTVRLTSDPVYPAPYLGWSYLFDGSSMANSLTEALDATWDHQGDSWAGDGRGAGNDLMGGVSTTNGVLTIEDAVNSNVGAFDNRRFYFTRNLSQDSSVTNQATLLNDGVTLTFRARLTPPTDPWIELADAPNGLVNNSDGKGMFGIRQSGSSGLILGFSLNRASEDLSATTSFSFAQAGLHMNNLNGNVRTSVVDPGEAGTVNLLPMDPAVFHEFWITIQDNGADPGTHRVSIFLDGSTTPTVFNVTAGLGVDGPASNYLALGMGSSAQRGSVDVDFFGYRAGAIPPSAFNQPVGFSVQPANRTVSIGESAVFVAGITGTPPYSIQWYRDGSTLENATNASYATAPVTANDEGAQFTVVVSNEFSSATSSPPAVLHLLSAPVITSQPQSLTVTNGDSASFSVVTSSGSAPGFQWRRNQSNLVNATNSTLLIAGAGAANAGSYDVIVSNSSGSVTSLVATLSIVFFDFGDAPDSGFTTLKASNGARHILANGIHLGATNDAEVDGQAGSSATGDDLSGIDDEDGVNFVSPFRAGQVATLEVIASTNGFLNGWVDFDRNGLWSGAGEQVFTNQNLIGGTNVLQIAIPGSLVPGSAYARFRFNSTGGLTFNGPAADGEVEDYSVSLSPVADLSVVQNEAPDPIATHSNLTYSITVSNGGPSTATGVTLSNVLPANVSFVSVLASQGGCNHNAGIVTCSLGMLASSGTIGVSLVIAPNSTGYLTNTVRVMAAETDLAAGNNLAIVVTEVLDAPTITAQPQNQTAITGGTANFAVSANGSPPLRYQWSKDGIVLSGETNASLSLSGIQAVNAGIYRVHVSNSAGGIDSQPATLTVLTLPAITSQPQSRTNFAGSLASFSVAASGTEPLEYRWLFRSTNLVAMGSASLILPSVQLTNAGSYQVAVSNAAGVVTSAVATLTVIEMDFGDAPNPYPAALAANGARHRLVPGVRLGALVDFEPEAAVDVESSGDDLSGSDDEDGVTFNSVVRAGESVSISVLAATNGVLNAWLDFDRNGSWSDPGEQIFTNRVLSSGNNSLNFITPSSAAAGLSFARFRFNIAGGLSAVGEADNGEVEDYAVSIQAGADLLLAGLTQLNPAVVGSNQIYTITVSNAGPSVATGAALLDTLPPGVVFVSASSTQGNCSQSAGLVSCSLGDLAVGGTRLVAITVVPQSAGVLTNVVSVGAVTVDPNASNNSIISTASALVFPSIIDQPQNLTVTNGGSGLFSVNASGTAIRYQWKREGIAIADATNAVLNIINANSAMVGNYSVTITNAVGSVSSASVPLTVLTPVAITGQPQTQTVAQGATVNFNVTATGSAPLSYQWAFNGDDLNGETQSSLVLSNVQVAQAGTYRVRVSNGAGAVTSSNAILNIQPRPTFLAQPQSRTNYAGSTAIFLTSTDGAQPIRSQWYFNATNLLVSQTNAVLTLTNVQLASAGGYTLVATNIAGASTSAVAVLTVYEMDFGDAPESLGYPTGTDFDGARHRLLPGIRMGLNADYETNGQPNLTATGDDQIGVDDEDGVTFPFPLLVGQTVPVAVVVSTNGFVDAWIDFNRNGTWADPSEQVLSSYPVSAGTNLVPVPVSASAAISSTFGRFRFSTVGATAYDGFAADGEVEDHLVSIQSAIDLVVASTDSSDPILVSGTVNYSIGITNRGPSVGTGVVLTNTLPGSFAFLSATPSQGSCVHNAGIVVCSFGSLPVNGVATVNLGVRANSAGTFTLLSRVSANEGEANPSDNSFSQQTSVIVTAATFSNLAAVSISDGSAAGPGKGNPYPSTILVSGLTGTVFKVTAALSNLSHSFASDLDVLLVGPGGQSVLLMSDAAGGFVLNGVTPTFDDNAELALPSGGVVSSTSYRPTAFDPTSDAFPLPAPAAPFGSTLSVFKDTNPNGVWSLYLIDDESSDIGTLGGGWQLSISTADPISDIAVTAVVSSNPVAVNSNLVYAVTITNRGPAAATGVALSNTLPAGVSFISAVPAQGTCSQQGGVVTCQIGGVNPGGATVVNITAKPNASGILTNTIQVSGNQIDFVVANNVTTVVSTALPATDLAVALTAATNLTLLGQQLSYALNVTNLGPVSASNVRVEDSLPTNVSFISAVTSQGSCTNDAGAVRCVFGSMPVGAHALVSVVVQPFAVGTLTNRAMVAADEIDSAANNNAATLVTSANIAADLAVVMVDSPGPVAIGTLVTYAISVTNLGPSTASSVEVMDPLPANVSFVAAVPSQGVCTNDNGTVRCVLGTLPLGGSAAISLSVTPNIAGNLTNVVNVSGSSVDPFLGNNSAQRITTIQIPPFITTGPNSQTVTSGVNVVLTVIAGGTAPFAFQWQFNGEDLTGATNVSLTLSNVAFAAGGSYRARVSNGVGSVLSGAALLTVLVPPTISDIAAQVTNEDTPTAPIPFTIGDVDSIVETLTLTRLSSNPSLIPTENIAVTGLGAVRQIVVTPVLDQFGTSTITIEVRDSNGLFAMDTFLLTVQPVNDVPTISELADQSTSEDTALVVNLSVGDVENLGPELAVSASSSNLELLAQGGIELVRTGTNWAMTLRPTTNQSGTATITVTVTDTNGASVNDAFLLTVNPVNDPPTLDSLTDLTIGEDAGLQSVALGGISTGAGNEVEVLTFSVTSSDTNIVGDPIIYTAGETSGLLRFSPATNVYGTVIMTVTLQDGSASNNLVVRSFQVTIVSSNDLPRVSEVLDVSIPQDTSAGPLDFTIEDVETAVENLGVIATSSDTNLVPLANILLTGTGTNRTITLQPAPDRFGIATIDIVVSDADGGTNVETFVLTVQQVVKPPTIVTQPQGRTVTNGATVSFSVVANGTAPLSYQWRRNGLDLPGQNSPILTLVGVQASDAGNYTVFVTNSAAGIISSEAALRVLISPSIVLISRTGTTASLTFLTENGLNYVVEFKDNVEAPVWNELPLHPGTGSEVTVVDNSATVSSRLYRIRVE